MNNRILVVDDSQPARLYLKLFLEKSGYEVIEAKDGYEAISLTPKKQPALILLDLNTAHIRWGKCLQIT